MDRQLEKFSSVEEPKTPFYPRSASLVLSSYGAEVPLSALSAELVHGTLKRFLTSDVSPKQVVYERCFPKSLPQQKRDSYFLTELYNVKRLIQRQGCFDNELLCSGTDHVKPVLEPYYHLGENDSTLVFESRFESGNLCLAIKGSFFFVKIVNK